MCIGHASGHVIEREVVLMKLDTSVELDEGSEHKFEVGQRDIRF